MILFSKSYFEWTLKNIKEMKSIAERLSLPFLKKLEKIYGSDVKWRGERVWSLKKLLVFAGYLPMYLSIIKNQNWVKKIVYIDLFSGCGFTCIGERKEEIVAGSPLLALYWPKIVAGKQKRFQNMGDFNFYIFNDVDSNKIDLLRKIIQKLGLEEEKYAILNLTANDAAKLIAEKYLDRECHYILFIDPYGEINSQIDWDRLELLLNYHGDVIINLQSPSIARGLDMIKEDKLKAFLGEYGFNKYKTYLAEKFEKEKALREAYKDNLIKSKRKVIEEFPVETWKGKILYYLVFAVKYTKGGSKWLKNYIKWAIDRLGNIKAEDLRIIWGIASGKQTRIYDHFR